MNKILKTFWIVSLGLALTGNSVFLLPTYASGSPFTAICAPQEQQNLKTSPTTPGTSPLCTGTSTHNPIITGKNGSAGVIDDVADIISIIAGITAIIIIIVGGIMYILSGGDSQKINQAKDTILFAIIGLAVIAVARLIIGFVIGKV